jgi:amino acid transporter
MNPTVPTLQRHFGLLQATALNITQIVGAGVFITIPLMLKELPGPYALLGWVTAGAVMVFDSLIWSELGATLPGSGGSYLYLLECFGRHRWGRLMAFLFIWQFLISGPLELGSGLIAIAQFSSNLGPDIASFDKSHEQEWQIWPEEQVSLFVSPSRIFALAMGVLIIFMLYRRIAILGKLTVTIWIGVLAAIAWVLIEGFRHFDPAVAFRSVGPPQHFASNLGAAMRLAMYSYLGYYSICYIGDEVRNPGRTIPRSILLSALLVCLLFVGVHLAMMGTVPYSEVPIKQPADDPVIATTTVTLAAPNAGGNSLAAVATNAAGNSKENLNNYSLPAEFMKKLHGDGWAVKLLTVLLVWTCFGSAFAGMLAYSRIPYGAARYGHFFSVFGIVHPRLAIPHISLLLVGGLTLVWSFFSLDSVITALITTRIIEQFIGQIVGVVLLRRTQPERLRPYKMWLYPLPCALALVGWLYMYVTARLLYIGLGLGTLVAGVVAFLYWSWLTGGWPFLKEVELKKDIA